MTTSANAAMAASSPTKPQSSSNGMAITILYIILWYTTSMMAITTSKLTMQAAKVPLVLCSVQFLCATVVSGTVLALQGLPLRLPGKEAKVLGATSFTYTLGFFFTNLAFSLANASFVETVKSGEPISTVVLAYFLLGELERVSTYASLIPVVIGVGMASSGEAGGSLSAFIATVGSNFGFSARAVFAKQLKVHHKESPSAKSDVSLFFQISWMGLVALLPFALVTEGPTLSAAFTSPAFEPVRFLAVILVNGLMYTSYNQFSFMVLSRVSTSSHAVLNVCRRVCVIGATTLFFGTPLSMLNMVGIVVAVAGMFWFTQSKSQPAQQKPSKKLQ